MSEAERALAALLRAYIAGDRTARLALVDWLEERGDVRAEAVRAAKVDWDAVAWDMFFERNPHHERRRRRRRQALTSFDQAERNQIRWSIDCVLVGAGAADDLTRAVRRAHRAWLAALFPEAAQSLSDA